MDSMLVVVPGGLGRPGRLSVPGDLEHLRVDLAKSTTSLEPLMTHSCFSSLLTQFLNPSFFNFMTVDIGAV